MKEEESTPTVPSVDSVFTHDQYGLDSLHCLGHFRSQCDGGDDSVYVALHEHNLLVDSRPWL